VPLNDEAATNGGGGRRKQKKEKKGSVKDNSCYDNPTGMILTKSTKQGWVQ